MNDCVPMEDVATYVLRFHCRKCEQGLELNWKMSSGVENLFQRLQKVSNLDCPHCGEEPYDNWVFDNVQQK